MQLKTDERVNFLSHFILDLSNNTKNVCVLFWKPFTANLRFLYIENFIDQQRRCIQRNVLVPITSAASISVVTQYVTNKITSKQGTHPPKSQFCLVKGILLQFATTSFQQARTAETGMCWSITLALYEWITSFLATLKILFICLLFFRTNHSNIIKNSINYVVGGGEGGEGAERGGGRE